ncbi:porin [Colwelliaceae bacterium MEBiC 14330]
MKKSLLSLALVSAVLSSSVLADEHVSGEKHSASSPNWTYVQGSYVMFDIEDSDGLEPSGFGVKGSRLIGDNFFVMGGFSLLNDEVALYGVSVDVDYAQLSLGLGYRYGLTESSDIYMAVSYEDVALKASAGGFSENESDNGYGIQVGVRSMVTDSIELSGSLGTVSIDSESETAFGLGADYFINKNFSLGLGYSSSDDMDTTSFNLRYSY